MTTAQQTVYDAVIGTSIFQDIFDFIKKYGPDLDGQTKEQYLEEWCIATSSEQEDAEKVRGELSDLLSERFKTICKETIDSISV